MQEVRFEKLDKTSYQMTLDNYFKVLVAPMIKSEKVTIGINIDKGSFSKPMKIGNQIIYLGTAAYLFEAIRKYHSKEASILFEEGIKDVSSINKSYTSFAFEVPQDRYLECIKALFALVNSIDFTNDQIEDMKKDMVDLASNEKEDLVANNLFIFSPIKNSTYGGANSIKNIHLVALKKFFNEYYIPSNMTLVVTGNVDQKKIEEVVNAVEFEKKTKKDNVIVTEYNERYDDLIKEEVNGEEENKVTLGFKFDKREKLFDDFQNNLFALYLTLPELVFSKTNSVFNSYVKSYKTIVSSSLVEASEEAYLKVTFETDSKEKLIEELKAYLSDMRIKFKDVSSIKKEVLAKYREIYINDSTTYYYDILNSLANNFFFLALVLQIKSIGYFTFKKFIRRFSKFRHVIVK